MSFNIVKQLNAEAQEATASLAEVAATKNVPVVTPHDDFDWSVDKRNVSSYNKEEKAKYDTVYDNTFKQINDGEMIQATIEAITKTDAVVNIGFKSDGLISLNEFRDIVGGLKVGDIIEVMVVEKEDRDGNLHLSRKQARTSRAWERIVEIHKTGEIVTGLLYVDESVQDVHELNNTPPQALTSLPYAKLCPGSEALATLQESFR